MSFVRSDSGNNLGLMIATDNAAYTHASVSNFSFSNILNTIPTCNLTMVDNQSSFIRNRSLGFLSIYFTNTADDVTQKESGITGIIDDTENKRQVSGTSNYNFNWSAGDLEQLKVNTLAFNGSSIEVLGNIFENRSTLFDNRAKDNIEATDNMWWRFAQDNMWEQLNSCVSKSYVRDDYLFWVWDDVNSKFVISSFNLEMAQEDKYVMFETDVAKTSTGAGLMHLDNPKITMWGFDKHLKKNELGQNRNKLFPNLYIEGDGGTGKTASVSKGCFSNVLADMGDTSKETISEASDIKDPNTTFGPRKVTRHFPNNTHKFYSLAEMYRDYKLATYSKVIYVQVYNQMGPPMGSKVTVLTAGNDYKINGFKLDRFYSDKYIVAEKNFSWKTVDTNSLGKERGVSESWVTTIKLISNNINDGDPDHIASILKSIGASA